MTRSLVALLLSTLSIVACSEARTQVMVRVYAEPEVQRSLASLGLRVSSSDGSQWRARLDESPVLRTELAWPVELAIVPDGDRTPLLDIVATARDAEGKVLVFDRAVTRFDEGQTRVLTMTLTEACMGTHVCEDPSTCDGPSCQVCKVGDDGAQCAEAGTRETTPFSAVSHRRTESDLDAGTWRWDAGMPAPDAGRQGDCATDGGIVCRAGYRCEADDAGVAGCADIDECEEEWLCGWGECTNTVGSFSCTCEEGLSGIHTCEREIDCDPQDCFPGGCAYPSEGVKCACPIGYANREGGCTDVDECATGACGDNACRNVEGSYACRCAGSDLWCDRDHPCATSESGPFCIGELADYLPRDATELEALDDEAWHDRATGLFWFEGRISMGWDQAHATCDELELAGRTDWRLATIAETLSVIDYERCLGCSRVTSGSWANRRDLLRATFYTVPGGWGGVREIDTSGGVGYGTTPLCVSGASSVGMARTVRFVIGPSVVEDKVTKLTWQRFSTASSWYDAAALCESLTLEGFDDFRIPNPKELYTLVDARAPDGRVGGFESSDRLDAGWTSMPYGQRLAMGIAFSRGTMTLMDADRVLEIRCVRASSP